MDEARIEDDLRSPAWVWASWATVANNSFATYGAIAPPTVTLRCQRVGGHLVLTWMTGTLQSADSVLGPYSDIAGAASPFMVDPSSPREYFRVRIGR